MSYTEPTRSVVGCFRANCGVNPSLNATTMKRASELWNKRVSDRLEQESAELREALQSMVDGYASYDLVHHTGLTQDECQKIIDLALNK